MFTDFSCAITIIRYNILFIIMIFLSTILLLAQHYSPSHHIHTRVLKKWGKSILHTKKLCVASGSSHAIELYVAYRLRIKYYRKNLIFRRSLAADFLASHSLLLWCSWGYFLFTLPFKHKKSWCRQEGMSMKYWKWNHSTTIRIIIIFIYTSSQWKNELFMYFSHFLRQPYDDVDVRFY